MGWFGTALCAGCGEKTFKGRLSTFETTQGPKQICPGCLEIETMRARRVAEHAESWDRVRRSGGSVLIEGAASLESTWQDLPPDMVKPEDLTALLDGLPITQPRGARLSARPFALESVRRPLRGADLFEHDPTFLAQILEAYSLEDMLDEAASVLAGYVYERVSVIPFIGEVEMVKKVFAFDREAGRVTVSSHYALAAGTQVTTAAGGIERPIKRMVLWRAGENRYVWCKFVDRE